MRVLCATTGNDGHFGPLLPYARACADAGHEVRVAAPASYAASVASAGLRHEPFPDAPRELIGPLMARLPKLSFKEADDLVIREVFGRVDAQAALPVLIETIGRWRPDVVLRESAELASLAAAERAGVPHVHVCIGMHEVVTEYAHAVGDALAELEQLAGLDTGRLASALADETVLSSVPESLDLGGGSVAAPARAYLRFHEPPPAAEGVTLPGWGDQDAPLVYVSFGSVTGSLRPFSGVFRIALDALADVEGRVLLTVGRKVEPADLGPLPANAYVAQWLPQQAVLQQATAMLGHGGFGTTMGALTAGVPQVVAPLFTFDQVVNGQRVVAAGAGLSDGRGLDAVARAAELIPRLLADPTYAAASSRVAAMLAALPPPSQAVTVLEGLAG